MLICSMEIYLIRHTTPAVEKGICYGQTDLDVTESFEEEVEAIKTYLPNTIKRVYSSPLQRCSKLAQALFQDQDIHYHQDLMELNCGNWEMLPWNQIPKSEVEPWLADIEYTTLPGGENYQQMYERVIVQFEKIANQELPAALVAHGGVLRSILAFITNTSIKDSFNEFTCHYGSIVKIKQKAGGYDYEMVYNVSRAGKEWHRPEF